MCDVDIIRVECFLTLENQKKPFETSHDQIMAWVSVEEAEILFEL